MVSRVVVFIPKPLASLSHFNGENQQEDEKARMTGNYGLHHDPGLNLKLQCL